MSSDSDRNTGDGADSYIEAAPPTPAHDLHAAIEADDGDAPPKPTWLPMRVLEWLGALVILALTVGITYSVAVRAAGHGLTGAIELAGLAMVFVVILGAPGLALRDEHVRLELADFVLGKKALTGLQWFGLLFQFLVVALLCFAMWQVLQADLRRGTTVAGDLRLPRYWVSGSVLVGFVFLGLALIKNFIDSLRHKDPDPAVETEA
ncbi:MAG: TRAP transporter small permease subunit [Propionibacteriaceae bacterium]|nr:TRAP transporter small permease subunit [Propionibacteriaceae bacterium]